MPDRTINFGENESEATYQIQDTDGAAGGGNFVIAKDTNANTVLLQYNPSTDAWEYAGDVDMGGGDIMNANAIESTTVDSDAVGTPTIIDTEDGTNYDVGDQLVGFGDSNGDGTYELPNATDGIDVESVNTGEATIDGKTGDGTAASSTDESSLGFDTWKTPNVNRPVCVFIRARAFTDGITDARVELLVDETGGTTPDYQLTIAQAHKDLGSDGIDNNSLSHIIPSGSSIQISNALDPQNVNDILTLREAER